MTVRIFLCLVWCSAAAVAASRPQDLAGTALFAKVWTVEEGAGPLANAQSCSACHSASLQHRLSVDRENFVLVSPMERDPSGGPVFQRFLFRPGRAVVRRPLPPKIAGRRPPALHGVGLLASVPADAITALEDPTDRNGDGISGRARRVAGAVGRFGWKARAADLEASVAAALVNEMGLTNTRHGTQPASGPVSPEVSAAQLARLVGFVRLLPAPAPSCGTPVNEAGRRWFDATGCARCHVPSLPAGRSKGTHPVIHAYTDLLLHDVGAELSDGFEDGDTAGAEFRTAPLWGLGRTPPPYLHDGRAATLDAAIRAHAGEALSSRRDYAALTSEARAALRSFLNCL